jgi:hypothetical protein
MVPWIKISFFTFCMYCMFWCTTKFHVSCTHQRIDIPRGPRNLSNHMDRKTRTRDIVLVKSKEMIGRRNQSRDRRPCTTACPEFAGRWGQINWNSVCEEKIFEVGRRGQPKISCTGTTRPTNQPREDPFHFYSLSPHSPQFNSQQWPTLSYLSPKHCHKWLR